MTSMYECSHELKTYWASGVFIQNVAVTVLVASAFVLCKCSYDRMRKRMANIAIVIVGGGPIGLVCALMAARSGKATQVTVYEERSRHDIVNRPYQIGLDPKSVSLLASLGVDFDNIEGCWKHKNFFTRIGVFQEYLISLIATHDLTVQLRLKNKFTRSSLKELETISERVLAIVCDGFDGRSASLLGLSDEFSQHTCRAYGAVAALERPEQPSIPIPEIRIHNVTFDLHAYGNDGINDPYPQGFHLKLFGSARHRYQSIIVPRGESRLVKTLRVMLDRSIMRNIFQACYNSYRPDSEPELDDVTALKGMKFSPRLFEVKLHHRMENVAYIEEANLFVLAEGEASRCVNYNTGMDINLGMRGIQSLEHFIHLAAMAENEKAILSALHFKHAHSRAVMQEYLKNGLNHNMYT